MPVAFYFDNTDIFTQLLYKYMPMFKLCLFCPYNNTCILNCQCAFNYIHIPGSAYRVQSVFIWRCTSSNNARTIIQRHSLSRAVRLYYLQTIQAELFAVFRKTVTITAYRADFHALQTIII